MSVPRPRPLACCLALLLAASPAAAGARKSLVIAVDGLRSDGILSAATPAFDRLIKGSFGDGSYRGAFAPDAQTIQDAPTSSAYNHCSIMTGVTGARHGVAGNDAASLAAVDYLTYPHYLTTLEQADASLNTAYLVTWGPDLAIFSGADYIKDGDDESNTARVVALLEGLFDDPAGDDGTAWAAGTEPDAVFLFLDDIDGAGHGNGFGPWTAAYLAEVEQVDGQIGRLLDALESRPGFAAEEWQVVVTSDHGGFGTGHGGLRPNEETIPFLVTSRDANQGLLEGAVSNVDAASTAIAHVLGAAAVPAHHDGVPRGGAVQPPSPPELDRELVLHLPFDADLRDASGRGNDASVGNGVALAPSLRPSGGACGGYLEVSDPGGGAAGASYLSLGNPADLELGTDQDFSLAVWVRSFANQAGDSVIFGNKDWASGLNPGLLLLANEGDGDDFGFNVADGVTRRDVEPLDFTFGEWWLLSVSVDRDGSAIVFVGSPDGRQFLIADRAAGLGDLSSPLPWNVGQDGTGSYPSNLAADLDELRVWRRALRLDELQRLHADGLGACALRLLRDDSLTQLSPPTPALASLLPLDPELDFVRTVLPSQTLVSSGTAPLAFLALDGAATLLVEKAGNGELRLSY